MTARIIIYIIVSWPMVMLIGGTMYAAFSPTMRPLDRIECDECGTMCIAVSPGHCCADCEALA